MIIPSKSLDNNNNQQELDKSFSKVIVAIPSSNVVEEPERYRDRNTHDLINPKRTIDELGLVPIPSSNVVEEPERYGNRNTHDLIIPERTIDELRLVPGTPINWKKVKLSAKPTLESLMQNRFENFIGTDCIVLIEDEEFSCHLIVLRKFSSFFKDINQKRIIEISNEDCTPTIFAFLYEWMISDQNFIRELNEEVILDVYKAAKFFSIEELIEQIWSLINNPKIFFELSAFKLYVEANDKNVPEVYQVMLPQIKDSFMFLLSSTEWVNLSSNEVQFFLKSNYVVVNSELDIFMAAIRWLFHDWKNRANHKIAIISCVRFGNMSSLQLVDITHNKRNPEFIELFNDPELASMVDEGLTYAIFKETDGKGKNEWYDVLDFKDPESRNWSKFNADYRTYNEFLMFLNQYSALCRKMKTSFVKLSSNNVYSFSLQEEEA